MSTELLKAGQASYNKELENWITKEKAAVDLINAVGSLLFTKSVELVLFRNHLVDTSVSEILQLHQYAAEVVNKPIDVFSTSELAVELMGLDLAPSKLDIGKLSSEWLSEGKNYSSKKEFLTKKLVNFIGQQESSNIIPRDVVLYGFGRIGRLAARELIKQAGKGQQLRLRAVVTRKIDEQQLHQRAALLRMDSVHGPFPGSIVADATNMTLVVNGQIVKMIQSNSPEEIDYEAHGITNALVIDNTGAFRDRKELSRHLKAKGVSKVLLTAPGKEIPNIVYGINQKTADVETENIFSAASCTTNAICPILFTIENKFGIEKGHIETVHAFTNDQNLLDNMHKAYRRGRSAPINMVITETGANAAVSKVIPVLADKLTGNAVRVPVPNGSLAILNLQLKRETTIAEVNATIKEAALNGDLVNQIKYSIENELVSSDIVGDTCCSIFDSPATIISLDKKSVVLYVWYDNEFGYTKQVIRLAKHIAKVKRLIYY
jgi:glyceraldehyde 3-phosphate dehydrogenase